MIIAIDITSFNIKHVIILEAVKNMNKYGCTFMKTLYSTGNMTLNGIYLKVRLKDLEIIHEKDNYYTMRFNVNSNIDEISKITEVEGAIGNLLENKCVMNHTLSEELWNGNKMKVYMNDNKCKIDKINEGSFVIKIVGIWCNSKYGGLNYQIIYWCD